MYQEQPIEHKLTDAEIRAQLPRKVFKTIRELKEGDRFVNPFTGEVLIMKYPIPEQEFELGRRIDKIALSVSKTEIEGVDVDTEVEVVGEGTI